VQGREPNQQDQDDHQNGGGRWASRNISLIGGGFKHLAVSAKVPFTLSTVAHASATICPDEGSAFLAAWCEA
jgi:hypothetical protein